MEGKGGFLMQRIPYKEMVAPIARLCSSSGSMVTYLCLCLGQQAELAPLNNPQT